MILYYIAIIFAGVLLDWALYGGMSLSISVLTRREYGSGFRDHIFPHVLFTAVGATLIAVGTYSDESDRRIFLVGVAIFVMSNIYLHLVSFWPTRPLPE